MATTTKKTTTTVKKKTPVKSAAVKPVKAVKAPTAVVSAAPAVGTGTGPVDDVPTLRKKELIERVVARCGVKKKDAKPTIEAMLTVLGEALSSGEELNLHPMGKMKVTRVIDKPNATVMVTKVRRRKETAGGTVVKMDMNS